MVQGKCYNNTSSQSNHAIFSLNQWSSDYKLLWMSRRFVYRLQSLHQVRNSTYPAAKTNHHAFEVFGLPIIQQTMVLGRCQRYSIPQLNKSLPGLYTDWLRFELQWSWLIYSARKPLPWHNALEQWDTHLLLNLASILEKKWCYCAASSWLGVWKSSPSTYVEVIHMIHPDASKMMMSPA